MTVEQLAPPPRLAIQRSSEVRTLRADGRPKGRCLACGQEIRRDELFVRFGPDVVHADCGLYRPAAARAA